MGRYIGGVCKLCRREGEKLYLKGERCVSGKCSLNKRRYGPGDHGRRRKKDTDYRIRLREKQKVRFYYGLMESQFKNCFRAASRMRGVTGENLLQLLELRLDNIVYRSGFGVSRAQARQLVSHRHFQVDGRPVNIPSQRLRLNQVVSVREKSRANQASPIYGAIESRGSRGKLPPRWLEVNDEQLTILVTEMPKREDIVDIPINEQLIVELYSK
ncbi:30S ribosomal protein S4 [bacterium]|nr:30S ribosomal protein S4 [bacterium]